MTTFKQFISEDEHKNGTYVNAKLSAVDKDKLFDWVTQNGISNPLDKEEYHVTIIYSTTPCKAAESYPYSVPIDASITGWKIFDAPIGRCLVAAIESQNLRETNSVLRHTYGASSNFPDYVPHVTVSYNYEGELPTTHPEWPITFDAVEVKGLDPTWRPNK